MISIILILYLIRFSYYCLVDDSVIVKNNKIFDTFSDDQF